MLNLIILSSLFVFSFISQASTILNEEGLYEFADQRIQIVKKETRVSLTQSLDPIRLQSFALPTFSSLPFTTSKVATFINPNINSEKSTTLQKQKRMLLSTTDKVIQEQDTQYLTGLSIDGGGMRGLIPALYLEHIEKITNRRTYELFDFIEGTSVGGILALGITVPVGNNKKPYLAHELVELFEQKGKEIFPPLDLIWQILPDDFNNIKSPRYSSDSLEALLKNYFQETKLNQTFSKVIITAVETRTQKPFLFQSWQEEHSNYPIWKVARSTSAAPTYFPSYFLTEEIELVDGGLYRNNPTATLATSMFSQLRTVNRTSNNMDNLSILSLGTGNSLIKKVIPSYSGKINGEAIIETMMTSSSIGVDEAMRELFPNKNQYTRINPDLDKSIPLDEVKQENIDYLKEAAISCYEEIEDFFNGDQSQFRKILERKEKHYSTNNPYLNSRL